MTVEVRSVPIHVTQGDLAAGKRAICESCPAALAISRALRPGLFAYVGHRVIQVFGIDRESAHVAVATPDHIRPFLQSIDVGCVVGPFRFVLSLPVDVLRAPDPMKGDFCD